MVQSATEICNLALGHIGVSSPIGNMDTEQSTEAQICRTFYRIALEEIMDGMSWTFCKKYAVLELVTGTQADPATVEWTYAYRYPPDCRQFIRIISDRLNNDTRQSRIDYTVAADAAGLLIYTNWPGLFNYVPHCEYIFFNTNVGVYPPIFVVALSYLLAKYIAPTLTSGDPFGLGPKCEAMYTKKKAEAANSYLNEEQRPQEPQSEFVRARDYGANTSGGESWSATPSGVDIE